MIKHRTTLIWNKEKLKKSSTSKEPAWTCSQNNTTIKFSSPNQKNRTPKRKFSQTDVSIVELGAKQLRQIMRIPYSVSIVLWDQDPDQSFIPLPGVPGSGSQAKSSETWVICNPNTYKTVLVASMLHGEMKCEVTKCTSRAMTNLS